MDDLYKVVFLADTEHFGPLPGEPSKLSLASWRTHSPELDTAAYTHCDWPYVATGGCTPDEEWSPIAPLSAYDTLLVATE